MLSRRDFLKLATASIAGLAVGEKVSAQSISWPLWMKRGKDEYRFDAATPQGFAVARYLLRDIQGGDFQGLPHLQMLQSLSLAQSWFAAYGVHSRFDATSGLRLRSTNARTEGASRNSMHLPDAKGWFFATDFRPRGVEIKKASGWMRAAGLGGIGIYLDDDFLHVDVGPVRAWMRS